MTIKFRLRKVVFKSTKKMEFSEKNKEELRKSANENLQEFKERNPGLKEVRRKEKAKYSKGILSYTIIVKFK